MEYGVFLGRLRANLPEGTVLPNPGGGTSTIAWIDENRLCYVRGKSRFYLGLEEMYRTYGHFAGEEVTTGRLKAFSPSVFDSSRRGHSCNCTLLFLVLQRMGLAGTLAGEGKRGAPFGVVFRL